MQKIMGKSLNENMPEFYFKHNGLCGTFIDIRHIFRCIIEYFNKTSKLARCRKLLCTMAYDRYSNLSMEQIHIKGIFKL